MTRSVRLVGFCLLLLVVALTLIGCNSLVGGPGLTISASASKTTLQAGDSTAVSSTVMHAGGNPAVTWSLSGASCPNNCGILVNSNSASTTYSAPDFAPSAISVTVTATAVADPSKSASVTINVTHSLSIACPSGNEGALSGQYAFLMQGGGKPGVVALVGSLTADGKGNITAGLEDSNGNDAGPQTGLTINGTASLYTVGSDQRGCLGIVNSQNTVNIYRFALGSVSAGVADTGWMIEFDDATGNGTRAEGFLARQNSSSFSSTSLQGNYAFALAGPDSALNRMVSAGVINANAGNLSSGNMDSNDAGTLSSDVLGVTGIYSVASSGRGTLTLSIGGGSNYALYMISSARFVALSIDALNASHPLQSGEFDLQTLASFTDASLNAAAVFFSMGYDNTSSGPTVGLGLVSPDGLGNATLHIDQNDAGVYVPLQTSAMTYTVSANGRTTTSGLNHSPVWYLIGPNAAFFIGTNPNADLGRLEPQSGGPFSITSLSGNYSYGTEGTAAGTRLTAVGSINFDGIGNDQATEDDATPTGLSPNLPLPVTQYSFSSTSVPPGRGTLNNNGNTVAYIISPTKLLFFNTPASKPRILIVQQ
ncbi:MAG TPA: hypothetical protein VEI01_15855 [Terriglobales bacterium]|nr:hypothetical protein [Terriglobales bacterium]